MESRAGSAAFSRSTPRRRTKPVIFFTSPLIAALRIYSFTWRNCTWVQGSSIHRLHHGPPPVVAGCYSASAPSPCEAHTSTWWVGGITYSQSRAVQDGKVRLIPNTHLCISDDRPVWWQNAHHLSQTCHRLVYAEANLNLLHPPSARLLERDDPVRVPRTYASYRIVTALLLRRCGKTLVFPPHTRHVP